MLWCSSNLSSLQKAGPVALAARVVSVQSAPLAPPRPSLAPEVQRDGLSCDEGRRPVSSTPGSMFTGKYLHHN